MVMNLVEIRGCATLDPFGAPVGYQYGDPPCPADGVLKFNTVVALSKTGQLLAK